MLAILAVLLHGSDESTDWPNHKLENSSSHATTMGNRTSAGRLVIQQEAEIYRLD